MWTGLDGAAADREQSRTASTRAPGIGAAPRASCSAGGWSARCATPAGRGALGASTSSAKRRALARGDRRRSTRADVLTIGFARRFATYKRAGLLFSDLDRLARAPRHADGPCRSSLAGKAHPADEGGKELIRRSGGSRADERLAGRVAFLPDYEMALARSLVQGVDVWLNTPLRPLEASGTSGMKAAHERRRSTARSSTAGGARATRRRRLRDRRASRPSDEPGRGRRRGALRRARAARWCPRTTSATGAGCRCAGSR